MRAVGLLTGLYTKHDLGRYLTRQRCGPQPGMRRVDKAGRTYVCWLYEDHAWNRRAITRDRDEALSWWLGDPWLPNQQFEYGNLADRVGRAELVAGEPQSKEAAFTEAHWTEAATALAFHVVTQTGVRPHEVGPESTDTGALVYRRLRDRRAAAQIYWYEGRSSRDDLRGACPIRTDIPPMLRCVVLAETAVLLSRRPHVEIYIGVDDAPPGVAAEAASVLRQFDLPRRAHHLLLR